jgi:hypothetical protein
VTCRRSPAALATPPLCLLATAAAAPAPHLGARDLLAHVAALTAPAMEGRGSGTPEGDRAARHIADVLQRAGLRPGGDAGSSRP